MADKLELEARERRAHAAAAILDDDMFKGAVKALRDKALAEFKKADPQDHMALATARLRYDVTQDFVNEFAKIVRQGQKASHDLKESDK